VGVFSIYFAKQLQGRGEVYAFDPSRKVYQRLLQNVEANSVSNLHTFNSAVGDKTQFAMFAEPEGHLTNGSLVESFASQFSQQIKKSPVQVIAADEVAGLLSDHKRVLIKIDTEGFEAQVLSALGPILREKKPDLIIEVLPEFVDDLNGVELLWQLGYQPASITPEGLVPSDRFVAKHWRDCFLTVA
jgi:FkbM family methyltransferase